MRAILLLRQSAMKRPSSVDLGVNYTELDVEMATSTGFWRHI